MSDSTDDILLMKGVANDWQCAVDDVERVWFEYKHRVYDYRHNWIYFLTKWCGDKQRFIREFAYPARRITDGVFQIHRQLLYFGCEKRNSCYLTIYEFTDTMSAKPTRKKSGQLYAPVYESAVVDMMAFDFDQAELCPKCYTKVEIKKKDRVCPKCKWSTENAENNESIVLQSLYDVWREVKMVWKYVERASVVFTGGRGFQMRRPYPAQPVSGKDAMRLLGDNQKIIRDAVRVISMDDHHFGDVARVYRLPYTLHHKRLRYCIPVQPNQSMDEIHKLSLTPQIPSPISYTLFMGE